MPRFVAPLLWLLFASALQAQAPTYGVERVFRGLPPLAQPVDLQHAPGHPDLLFVALQQGRVLAFDRHGDGADWTTFLDFRDRVYTESSWEEGFLGFAFHPDFAENGFVFVHYNAPPLTEGAPHRSILSRLTCVLDGRPEADPGSELILLELNQPRPYHNGGQIAFGPDGFLYVALGDGGGAGDPDRNAQNRTNLFGSLLRLDISGTPGSHGPGYDIPDDNPYAGNTENWREEIWAFGLRNPWRFSFDPVTGWLWLGDVGQSRREEVNLIVPGGNYGWNVMEGTVCTPYYGTDDRAACETDQFLPPLWELDQETGDRSITGGHVYRGQALPGLYGHYVFADFVSGRIYALEYDGTAPPVNRQIATLSGITSFGVDADRELYLLNYTAGIYRLLEKPVSNEPPSAVRTATLRLSGPNPVRDRTSFTFTLDRPAHARLDLVDVLGRSVRTLHDAAARADVPTGVRLDAAGLDPGIYVARLLLDGRPAAHARVTVVR
jgi:glucose/arabinose dehydrogenase